MPKLIDEVVQVASHRNGVGGAPFYAVLFKMTSIMCGSCNSWDGWVGDRCIDCGGTTSKRVPRLMVATVFDDRGVVSVLDVGLLSDPAVGVAFGANSWRGDQFEAELRAAIRTHDSDGSVRVGPFAIPTERAEQKTAPMPTRPRKARR